MPFQDHPNGTRAKAHQLMSGRPAAPHANGTRAKAHQVMSGHAPQQRPNATRAKAHQVMSGAAALTPRVFRAGVSAVRLYGEYRQGVMEGLGDSVRSTWGFVSRDAWQVKTWTDMGTTMVAVSLMNPQYAGTAQWLDGKLGTQLGPRQVQIVMALDQTFKEMPHWQARQWGKLVGRVVGDVLTTKGAGGVAKTGFRLAATEVKHVQAISKINGGLRQALPVYARFTTVRAKIPFANVSTLPNKSAFWSGLEGQSKEAKALAQASSRTSLEMTPGGAWLEAQSGLLNNKVDWFTQMRPQWARLSHRFAQQARGSVEVFRGPRFDSVRSIWVTVEEGALHTSQRAGKVTEIIIREVPKK